MPSIGERLRQERLRQGLNLDAVASGTRINVGFLQALEEEEFDALPGRFFTRSFLRQYAAFLGLDEDLIEEALAGLKGGVEEQPGVPPPAAPPIEVAPIEMHFATRREARKRWLGSIAALVLAVAIGAGVYAVWQRFHAAPIAGSQLRVQPLEAAARPAAPASKSVPAALPPSPPEAAPVTAPAAPIRLVIRATEEAWIRVTSDAKVAFAGTLEAGQSRSFHAQQSLHLLTGNAGGIEAVFNDQGLGPLGPRGQVRGLDLTPAGRRSLDRKPPPEP